MTRRKVIFWNDLNDSYIVSEEYNGDKAEMERFGLGACDHTWPEFMEAMSSVSNLADFLKVISYITASYHAIVNGVPLPERANNLPGARLNVVHSHKELYNLVGDMDEVWEVKRNIPGAHLLDVSTIAPKPKQVWDGKEVIDEDDFDYATAKPGDFVTQAVVDNAMDCLPPVCMSARCSQMGEPYSSKLDEKTGEWRSTYATFRKVGGEWPNGIWEYCGHCFRGETVERAKKWLISKIFSLLLRDKVSIRRLQPVIKAGDENFGGVHFETVQGANRRRSHFVALLSHPRESPGELPGRHNYGTYRSISCGVH